MHSNKDVLFSFQENIKVQKIIKKKRKQSSQSDSFELQYSQIKKFGLQINKNKIKIGYWTPQQNEIYLKFLEKNKNKFLSEQERRKNRVFYLLSKLLRKRTPKQCRSHHQKFQMKQQGDIEKIIQNIKKKVSKKFPQLLRQYSKHKNVNSTTEKYKQNLEFNNFELIKAKNEAIYSIKRSCQFRLEITIFQQYVEYWN